jgi:hypothetical protein
MRSRAARADGPARALASILGGSILRGSILGGSILRGSIFRPRMYRPAALAVALLLPLAFLVHAGRALAASAAPARAAAALSADHEAPADAELVLCESADISIAAGAGACAAADGVDAAAPEPADAEPADAAARAAPMCDNDAASIAAVPEVPEVDRGQFEPARCDMQRLLSLLRSDERARCANVFSGGGTEKPAPPPIRLQQERLDAACSGGQPWPVPSAPALIAFEAPRGLGWQRGHCARIDRPPSQR